MNSMNDLQHWLSEHHLHINNPALIERAFFHTSYVNEHPHLKSESNQRLEFMGDAVLQLWTAHYLYGLIPTLTEGQMTKMRATLVCESSLFTIGKSLGLSQFLKLGAGEIRENGYDKASIVADMVESFIGALYLDGGMEPVDRVLSSVIKQIDVLNQAQQDDYKTRLQEFVQADDKRAISYVLVSETGPSNGKTFEMAVFIDDMMYGKGTGSSKKRAEQAAAKEALEKLVR
jgi:ribonuclease III